MEEKDPIGRNVATVVLQVASWLSIASCVIAPIAIMSGDYPVDSTLRTWCGIAAMFNGLIWWALFATLAWVSDEVRELHHHVSRAPPR